MYKVFFNDRIVEIGAPVKKSLIQDEPFCPIINAEEALQAWNTFRSDPLKKKLILTGNNPEHVKELFFGLFSIVIAAGGLVRNPHQELLCIYRFGKWDLPKGKVEKGESLLSAATREVEEECGINGFSDEGLFSVTYHLYEHPGNKNQWILKPTYWFNFRYEGNGKPVPQQNESITDVKWFDKKNIHQVLQNTWDSLQPLFNDWISFG